MCVGAHVREGGVGVRERIGLVDAQAEFAGFYSWQQIGSHAAIDSAGGTIAASCSAINVCGQPPESQTG